MAATTTLTEFLLARLAEDVAAARAATQGRWEYRNPYSIAGVGGGYSKPGECALCHAGPPIWTGRRDINGTTMEAHVHTFSPYDHAIVTLDGGDLLTVAPDGEEYGHISEANGAHIARHDPARVLAECEAKRRIVEHHERNPLSEEVGPEWADLCRVCTDAHEPEEWPCITLRAIALPYTDHPDYRDEWRP